MTPYLRILLRYAAGFLVARGILGQDMADLVAGDPEIIAMLEIGAGIAIAAIVEGWYRLAKRMGWTT